MLQFDLYFDESGNFEDAAPCEAGIVRQGPPQKSSQLVGILAPAGKISPESAERLLADALHNAGMPLERTLHATELMGQGRRSEYSRLFGEFICQLEESGFQPVRLCNNAQIGFGDKTITYTSMVAELVVRIFELLTEKHGGVKIGIDMHPARVVTNGHEKHKTLTFIDKTDYQKRLNEQIAFAAVRRGVAHNFRNWQITGFKLGSGRSDRPLQICDLLSNASYRNFNNCTADQKARLKRLLGEYDFLLNRSAVLEEIVHHRKEGSLVHALQTIAENWSRPELDDEVRRKIKEQCASIVRHLATLPPSSRNIHLRQLADWGGRFLATRELDLADSILDWLEKQVAGPLITSAVDASGEDVFWFQAQLLILRLGEHNHRGELTVARPLYDRLKQLFPALAGIWEHAPLLTEAMTLYAVHLNDCSEYDQASRLMAAVEGFYGGLSALMSDALPGIFPERVRSNQRGSALGTRLQSEMLAGLSEPERLAAARKINEQAIDEFTSEDDRRRQYQYRCQIETFCGDLAAARRWLAASMGLDQDGHGALAKAIKGLEGFTQGFAFLHWSRIGMEAGRRGLTDESQEFLAALQLNKLDTSYWVTQKEGEYPAHGIRRHLAVAMAAAGRGAESRTIVDHLSRLSIAGRLPLGLIVHAGILEAAARSAVSQPDLATSICTVSNSGEPSPLKRLEALSVQCSAFPALKALVDSMLAGAKCFASSNCSDGSQLLQACRLIGQ